MDHIADKLVRARPGGGEQQRGVLLRASPSLDTALPHTSLSAQQITVSIEEGLQNSPSRSCAPVPAPFPEAVQGLRAS